MIKIDNYLNSTLILMAANSFIKYLNTNGILIGWNCSD